MIKGLPTKKHKFKNLQQKIIKKVQRNKLKNQVMIFLSKMKMLQYQKKSRLTKHGVKNQFMKKDKNVCNNSGLNTLQQCPICIRKYNSQ